MIDIATVRFCYLCYFEFQGRKVKIFLSRSCDHWNPTIAMLHKWLKTKENLLMNVVNQYGEKWNSFAEVAAFCHMTCRYFNKFLLWGVDRNWCQACFFYLVPGLICEGYWQVNSRRRFFALRTLSFLCQQIIVNKRLTTNIIKY